LTVLLSYRQDMNLQPLLMEELDASYDVVLCVNGIQYLTQPEAVLNEVRWAP
jgi:2-polyprenyl-3-methyl-5-hydroxy-6-metoxy-1,4-benzoquinol methylase